MQKYDYKRELIGNTESWQKVILPNDLFEKISPGLSDIRIFGITNTNDTIEAPYLLKIKSEKKVTTNYNYKILNISQNDKGYYFTIEIPNKEPINQLQLDFKQFNFDWKVSLEGSHNQQEWFTIVDNYRILSIKNAETFYQFTNVNFVDSKYHFYRLLIKSKEKPDIKTVSASDTKFIDGVFNDYNIKSLSVSENKQEQSTDLNIELYQKIPVSYIKINLNASYDYYRPVTLKYVLDSVKTKKGYLYNYRTLTDGTLNSIENNEFKFENTVANKIKISINNQDNHPLSINNVIVKGNVYELAVRFTAPATYFLTYGNPFVYSPNYDIERFISEEPETMPALTLGPEQVIEKAEKSSRLPLFENKIWLYGIIIVMILLLGWFSLKMMKAK
ncbi:DUF3999 family protein [Yeosuana sp.]|uniref:DUF3999 family protein n=1 Tax=Yeosuana sp. TaxID=2529388 RepID=UPI0040552E9F